jgi:mannosyltransferase OCH1-like enzyme
MIPKILHLCWISGDPYSPLIDNCLNSWKRVLPDYEIIYWNRERVCEIESIWLRETIESKKYAFASDYVRLYALFNFGGIYLDADVEIIKSFGPLLQNKSFIGLESSLDIEAAVIGAEPKSDWVKSCLNYYIDRHFIGENGEMDLTPLPIIINHILANSYGLVIDAKSLPNEFIKPYLTIYPPSHFSPKNKYNGRITHSKSTFCIHHLDGSWVEKSLFSRLRSILNYVLSLMFSNERHKKFVDYYRIFVSRLRG